MVSQTVQIGICITGLIVFGASLPILTPLATIYYESVYFVVLMTSIQFTLIFLIPYLVVTKGRVEIPRLKWTVFWSGFFSATMSLFKTYSSHPERTPPVMQSILAGISILPNVLFTKVILKKNVHYDKRFIIPSLILLFASLGISVIPLTDEWTNWTIFWIGLYLLGVSSRSVYCVLQEKYMMDTQDITLKNKITIMFYTRLVHLFVILPFFWLEYVIGYGNSPFTSLGNSFVTFFSKIKEAFILEGFILSYVVFYIFSVYLNSMSSNYNMIASVAITPSVGIFFTIFADLNPGVSYPIYIVIPGLVCSVASIILWLIGEKIGKEGYTEMTDKKVNKDVSEITEETKIVNSINL